MMRNGVRADIRRIRLHDETLAAGLDAIMAALLAACPRNCSRWVRRLWREEVEVALELREPIKKPGRQPKKLRRYGVQLPLPLVFRAPFSGT